MSLASLPILLKLAPQECLVFFLEIVLLVAFDFTVEFLEEIASLIIIFFERVHRHVRRIQATAGRLDLDSAGQIAHVDTARQVVERLLRPND